MSKDTLRGWRFALKRLGNAFRILLRSRMAIFGLILLILFGVLSLGAPLLTPYDPQRDIVSGSYSPPIWINYFSEGSRLSQNLVLEPRVGFPDSTALQSWQLQSSTSQLSMAFDPTTSVSSGTGSAMLTLDRSSLASGSYSATVSKSFSWPYNGPPDRFQAAISVLASNASLLEPVQVTVFIERVSDHTRWNLTSSKSWISFSLSNDPLLRFVDSTPNALWDPGETVVYDSDNSTNYNAGDIIAAGSPPPINSPLRFDPSIRYFDINHNGKWDAGESIIYDINNSNAYDTGETVILGPTAPVGSIISGSWQSPVGGIDSGSQDLQILLGSTVSPAQLIFSSKDEYAYGVIVTFTSSGSGTPLHVFLDNLNIKLLGTSWGWLGTDNIGHDVFAQLVWGSRVSLMVGMLAAAIGISLGLLIGLLAGYMGRLVDEVLMRFTDMLLVIPGLPLLIVLVAVLGSSLGSSRLIVLIIVIGFLGWMGFARVVRSQVLSLKERPFVEAAKAAGAGPGHIMTRHILPNIIGLIYVNLALAVPGAILTEAALSFLGLGDTTVQSWGRMLHDIQVENATKIWWWVIPPGIAIALISLSFVLIGYALDDVFNPRLRQRR